MYRKQTLGIFSRPPPQHGAARCAFTRTPAHPPLFSREEDAQRSTKKNASVSRLLSPEPLAVGRRAFRLAARTLGLASWRPSRRLTGTRRCWWRRRPRIRQQICRRLCWIIGLRRWQSCRACAERVAQPRKLARGCGTDARLARGGRCHPGAVALPLGCGKEL